MQDKALEKRYGGCLYYGAQLDLVWSPASLTDYHANDQSFLIHTSVGQLTMLKLHFYQSSLFAFQNTIFVIQDISYMMLLSVHFKETTFLTGSIFASCGI